MDEKAAVVADIRIYNQEELRRNFDFSSPEEALAKAFFTWGKDCANHINGDFAAMIFDRSCRELHLLRDHMGARPLVYQVMGSRVLFASHEYGLAKSGLCHTTLSEEKLVDTFFRFKKRYAQTDFRNIKKVIPGHLVSFSGGGLCRTHKYWSPERIRKDYSLTFDSAVDRLRNLIVSATKSRMESGKTGLHVSGGIDSCGIASIVADHTPDKHLLTGYSWTPEIFEEPVEGTNEREFTEAFSSDKTIPVKYLNLNEHEMAKNSVLPEFPTMPFEHPVMQMAGKDGIEVLFSGWGGDEFVSLSMRGIVNHLFFSFKWRTLIRYCREKGIRSVLSQFRTDILPFLVPFGIIPVYQVQRIGWSDIRLFKASFLLKHLKQFSFYKKTNFYGRGNRTKLSLNLINMYYLPERMESWAIHAERYGFEYKYPLLDKDVLEFWFSIPVEYTYQDFQSRLLFREAMKGILAEKIRTRKDKGEAIRIAFTFREFNNGIKYLESLFRSLSPQEHLPCFHTVALSKIFNTPLKNNSLKNIRRINFYTLYLRYVLLRKKYMTNEHRFP